MALRYLNGHPQTYLRHAPRNNDDNNILFGVHNPSSPNLQARISITQSHSSNVQFKEHSDIAYTSGAFRDSGKRTLSLRDVSAISFQLHQTVKSENRGGAQSRATQPTYIDFSGRVRYQTGMCENTTHEKNRHVVRLY